VAAITDSPRMAERRGFGAPYASGIEILSRTDMQHFGIYKNTLLVDTNYSLDS
jgi:hypothetical protein